MRSIKAAFLALLVAVPSTVSAQEIFHSIQSANLPTAETLPKGSWLFEISHRFGPLNSGGEGLWGIDGPVNNRLGLAYAPHDRVLLALQRSNIDDNLGLNAKVGVWSGGSEGLPLKVALMAGAAVSTQPFEPGAEDNESQLYSQILLNALFGGRFAVGVVPTYLHNRSLPDASAEGAVAVGVHGQLYVSPSMSLLAEWLVSEATAARPNDPAAFGIEFQTRGHFFKLIVTNQGLLNPTQFLGGAAGPDDWRFGFNITRLLPF